MKQTPDRFALHLKAFIIVELCLISYFITLAAFFRIALPDLRQQLLSGYYFPYTNSCTVGDIQGVNIHWHLIIFITICYGLYCLGQRLFPSSLPAPAYAPSAFLPTAGIALLVFLLTLQTANHIKIFTNERRTFSGKSLAEKQRFIHKKPYEFAQYCRQHYPGRHKGFLRSDFDPHLEPFVTQHRKLAYFLLPEIDIRDVYAGLPYDCLVFYDEKDGQKSVPPGFRIQGLFDSNHFLAIREKTE